MLESENSGGREKQFRGQRAGALTLHTPTLLLLLLLLLHCYTQWLAPAFAAVSKRRRGGVEKVEQKLDRVA